MNSARKKFVGSQTEMPTGVYKRQIRPARERILSRVFVQSSGCWLWLGVIEANGYGALGVRGRKVYAHRLAFEVFRGEIPAGMDTDHLCRNRACCNPEHLEPVTRRENVMRGDGPRLLAKVNGDKTSCKNGHEFTEANTHIRPHGGRSCRACNRAKAAKYRRNIRP